MLKLRSKMDEAMPTLPEGRLQFSRAVSTRFRSAEYILKMLQRQEKKQLCRIKLLDSSQHLHFT